MSCYLPSPKQVTYDTSDVEMRETSARDFQPREFVEENRYGGLVWRRFLVFIACSNGFGSFTIGKETCLERRNELDQEHLSG